MDPIGSKITFEGRVHLIIVMVSALAAILAVLASARGWFLIRGARKMVAVSVLALLVMLASGILSALVGTLDWAGIGIWQRMNTGAFSAWQITTAIYLVRASSFAAHPLAKADWP